MNPPPALARPLTARVSLLWLAVAVVCFQAAYFSTRLPAAGFLNIGYACALLRLAHQPTGRRSFYFGFAAGYLCFAPQLAFFWGIFQAAAIVLWLILALWIGFFFALLGACLRRWGHHALWLAPVFWTGIEYTRSELYYLKFSWLNLGYALPPILNSPGMYTAGFLVFLLAAAVINLRRSLAQTRVPGSRPPGLRPVGILLLTLILWGEYTWYSAASKARPGAARPLTITGVQLEFPGNNILLRALDHAYAAHPDTDLFVLSEYSCDGPVPDNLRTWCRTHSRYLIVGGKDPVPAGPNDLYYNTAFVLGPDGQTVYKQAKSVPIPFFHDGLPTPHQDLWHSPWGRIGICICYDLSFTRVTDRLAVQGAQLLLVPTMDVMDWGRHQHELHSRVAPVRAAEYGIPIFRLASSGISQAVDDTGRVLAQTHTGIQDEILTAQFHLPAAGTLPPDRWLAPLCVTLTGILTLLQIYMALPTSRPPKP